MPKIKFVKEHQARSEYIKHKLNSFIIRGVREAKQNHNNFHDYEKFVYELTKEDDYWKLLRITVIHKKYNARENIDIALNEMTKNYQNKSTLDDFIYINMLEVMKLYLAVTFKKAYYGSSSKTISDAQSAAHEKSLPHDQVQSRPDINNLTDLDKAGSTDFVLSPAGSQIKSQVEIMQQNRYRFYNHHLSINAHKASFPIKEAIIELPSAFNSYVSPTRK